MFSWKHQRQQEECLIHTILPKIAIFISLKLTLLSVNCHQFIHLLFLKEETLPAQNHCLTRILYFTSNITYSTIEVEINLSNPFAQQVLKFFRRGRNGLVCIGIFCYLKLSLSLVTLNSKQSVSFNVFHVHCNFSR